MKIIVCGSMKFAKQMLETKTILEKSGNEVFVPSDIEKHVENPTLRDDLEENYKHALETNIMKDHFNLINKSDAILVLNHPKNGIDGYIGTCTLIEMGLAYYLGKKIYVLNKTPKPSEARWAHEVRVMNPVFLEGDLTKLNNGLRV